MTYVLLALTIVVTTLGCALKGIERFGEHPSLRLISVDDDCPFAQQAFEAEARSVFSEFGFDSQVDWSASFSLNLFFSCLAIDSGYVVDSRMHLGIALPSGPVVYYESPTFGGQYEIGEQGITVQQFMEITTETVVKALEYSVERHADDGSLAVY